MKNPERAQYPALAQAEIRALYQANPTRQMRRLVWEIYCLHVVVKSAGSVVRAHRMRDQLIPGGFDYVLPVSRRAYEALALHWRDRGVEHAGEGPLLVPALADTLPRVRAKVTAGRAG